MPNFVMTGATAGIGAVAAQQLAKRDGVRLIAGVRGAVPDGMETRRLDLASLSSVRAFAAAVIDALRGDSIDTLVLNAGGQRPDVAARSPDGHELTFASNHLGHYLLLRLLAPRLRRGGRVVITTSGTHDPAEKKGVPAPRHADAFLLADPDRDPQRDASAITAGMRAYSASKLCNLMTARALAMRRSDLVVIAYDPGLTPGTGLVRSQPWAVRTLVWPLLPLIIPFGKSMNSLANAGKGLADLVTDATPPMGHVYASLRKGRMTWPEPSALARDDMAVAALWQDSAVLAGID